MALVLDSGGVSALAERSADAAGLIAGLRQQDLWPPLLPTPVMVECLRGHAAHDALANRLVNSCDVVPDVSERLARRAAELRWRAGRGSAVDALVVAFAEHGGSVLTSDPDDLEALAAYAHDVLIMAA
ncbi:MAG: PIN domain-containing protein [Solirubrobacterales bacterium]